MKYFSDGLSLSEVEDQYQEYLSTQEDESVIAEIQDEYDELVQELSHPEEDDDTLMQLEVVEPKKKKDKSPGRSKVAVWKPKPEDQIAQFDGKIFYLRFEKVFKPEKVGIYDKFYIKKTSYENQLETIVQYINFFMKFYDTDNEMITNYLTIKFAIDKRKLFTEENCDQLIDLIYEIFFTDSIIEKIKKLVDDNYLDDIESSDDSKKYAKKEKKHLESLEFTNQQIKILLRISFGMKCIAPIMLHYAFVNKIKIDKDSDLIYNFYRRLFDIFTDPGINIYNKLFTYVNAMAYVKPL